MSALDDAPLVHADDRATWRAWLEANHATASGAWLVTWKASSGRAIDLDYEAAVLEALCFGWVDSTGGRFDDERGRLYFAPRKVRSAWAATNKARVEHLIADGLMAPAGLAAIERAKANGSWEILDSVERLEVPPDLAAALDGASARGRQLRRVPAVDPQAAPGPGRVRAASETRAARVAQIAQAAARNERAL